AAAVAAAVWILTVAITKYSSLGSLLGVVSVPLSLWRLRQPEEYVYFGIVSALFAIYRHRANIQRLIAGTELHITDREPFKKSHARPLLRGRGGRLSGGRAPGARRDGCHAPGAPGPRRRDPHVGPGAGDPRRAADLQAHRLHHGAGRFGVAPEPRLAHHQ